MATQLATMSKAIPLARKAEKRQVKLKLGIQGPSGSGKTWGALALAKNLWPDAKVLVLDTENESASLYADNFEFDTIPLDPPFESSRYEACIDYAVEHKYDVLIIDSVTHQWDGDGGILRRKEEMDRRPNANSWANWAAFTPEHTTFVESIKQAPIHIIATMRTKQEYSADKNDKGKTKIVKMGMAPIQREGFDYEFTIVFDVQMDHKAEISKNRTGLFEGKAVNLADKKVADQLRAWLDSGKPIVVPSPQPTLEQVRTNPAPVTPVPHTPAPAAAAKVEAWSLNGDKLVCYVYGVQKRKDKNGKDFIAIKHNGKVNDKDMAFCFTPALFDALAEAKDRTCMFLLEPGKFVTIIDLMAMDGIEFRDGKVYEAPELSAELPFQATDDDLPF